MPARLLGAALAALVACTAANSAEAFPCDLVRSYRAEIEAMPAETKAMWIKRLRVTQQQVEQAQACLRERRPTRSARRGV